MTRRRAAAALAAALGTAAVLAAPAAASVAQLRGNAGCVGGRAARVCTKTPYDRGPIQPVADPSNRFLYGITQYAGVATVAAFSRDSDGTLGALPFPTGCARRTVDGSRRLAARCARVRGLRDPIDLWMAPDGFQVYALTQGSEAINDGGVVTLQRGSDGSLSQPKGDKGCITELGGAGCADGRSLDLPRRMTMSLDGRSMYVTSATGGVAILRRDPQTGKLTQAPDALGCVLSVSSPVGSRCQRAPVPDLVPRDVAVAPDGSYLYVLMARYEQGAVAVYHRDTSTGVLTFANCIADGGAAGCTPSRGLGGAGSIAISPDGRSAYVAAHYFEDGGTVTSFTRDAGSGALIQLTPGCLAAVPYPDCAQGPKFLEPSSLAVSHDGATVYVTYEAGAPGGSGSAVLVDYRRDGGTGVLTPGSCVTARIPGCGKTRGVGAFDQVTISVDGQTLYLGGHAVLGAFHIDSSQGGADSSGSGGDSGSENTEDSGDD